MPSSRILLSLILLLGALLRLYFLVASQWLIEGDEAAVGLQALHILRGERPIFFPGQAYLGNFESYLLAGVFAVLGASADTLKLVPFTFALIFIFLAFQLGQELFNSEAAGLWMALMAAIAPVYFVMWSLKARGGFIEVLVLTQLALLWFNRWLATPHPSPLSPALRAPPSPSPGGTARQERGKGVGGLGVRFSPPRWLSGLIFGLISGYGLWMNPLIVYLLAPMGVVTVAHAARHIRGWRSAMVPTLSAATGGLIGLLPFILFQQLRVRDPFIRVSHDVPPQESWGDLVQQVWQYLWQDGLPTLLGLRLPRWPWMPDWRMIVIPIYVIGLLWLVGQARRNRGATLMVLMIIFAFPLFAFGSITGGNFAVIIPDSGLLTRYLLPLYILFTLALGLLLAQWPHIYRAGALGIVLAVNLWSLLSVDAVAVSRNEFSNQELPASNAELVVSLTAENLRYVYTNHWIGYPIMFETREQIITFDYPDAVLEMDRFPEYAEQVERAANPALVVFNPHYEPNPIDAKLKALKVQYQKKELQHFIVYYQFAPRVQPSALIDVLQWPYY